MVANADWKATIEQQLWDSNFMRGREFGNYMEQEYAQTKVIMNELSISK